jgi:hypothetical protein
MLKRFLRTGLTRALRFALLWPTPCILLLAPYARAQVTRPIVVPGRIEAENYDTNGSGVSYYDTSSGNSGGVYRSDAVDIEATTDTGGGYDVGWISDGEWLNYTISVQQPAVYRLGFRYASLSASLNIQATLDGLPLCGAVAASTGAWQTWQTATVSNIVLQAGEHVLQLQFKTGGYNLNHVDVTRQSSLSAGNFLRVSGKQIVDGSGSNVQLRGMGIGNWMIQEPYMMDASSVVTNQQHLKARITSLVGSNNCVAFYSSWLTNYFTAADVQLMAQSGFNSIRLPLHYNLFTLPVEQEAIPGQNTWLTTGFSLVDNLLSWCETNHIYLILDMHACPGAQGHDVAISDYNAALPSLWESSTNRAKLVALWTQLAARYRNREWIGGYDLINEPNWTFENRANVNGCSDTTNAPLRQLLMDITSAIRVVDTNHILFLSGNCWENNYSGILPAWDANSVIGFHKYWNDPTAASMQGMVDLRDTYNLPLWLGESGENMNEWFRDTVHACDQLNIGWAWWPWKKIGTTAGTTFITKPSGYQTILDYWGGSGSQPTTNAAMTGLLALAQATRLENCSVRRDVIDALLRPYPQGATLPFQSNTIPGRLFASDYDLGRQGEAYYDTTTNNSGYAYRSDAVDIQTTSDTLPTNGFNIGWLDAGDWMKYTLNPVVAGPYRVYARVAASSAGGSFYLDSGGTNLTGNIVVPATGGYQTWKTIAAGTITNTALSSFKLVVATNGFNLDWISLETVPGTTASLPVGWTDQDVGTVGLPGSGAYNASTSDWAITGSGADVWGTNDQFHFTCADLSGNGMLVARVVQMERTGSYPKAGIMLRDTLKTNSSYAFLFTEMNAISLESRTSSTASSSSQAWLNANLPAWISLIRTGSNISAYTSSDGLNWTSLGGRSFVMGNTIKAGLAVCANNTNALLAGVLDNVSITSVPATGPQIQAASTSAGQLSLAWPMWAAAYRLYTTTNLSAPAQWTLVTNGFQFQSNQASLTLPIDNTNRFFRLMAP